MTEPPIDVQSLMRELNEALILAVLRDEPKHGYQIALDVSERTDGLFGFQHGTLYPILHRLEQAGLLVGEWSDGDGRRRKEYHLTAAGGERLKRDGARVTRIFGVLQEFLQPGRGGR